MLSGLSLQLIECSINFCQRLFLLLILYNTVHAEAEKKQVWKKKRGGNLRMLFEVVDFFSTQESTDLCKFTLQNPRMSNPWYIYIRAMVYYFVSIVTVMNFRSQRPILWYRNLVFSKKEII